MMKETVLVMAVAVAYNNKLFQVEIKKPRNAGLAIIRKGGIDLFN